MFKLHQSWLRFLLLVFIPFICGRSLSADDTSTLTRDQIKQFLLTAKVVNVHHSKKGVTDTLRLTLSDGTITHDGSFQSIDEHTNVKKFADGHSEVRFVDSYKYNVAAYELAELVGLDDMIPVYVERQYEGHNGSLSWWLTVQMDEVERMNKKLEPPDPDAWNNQMYKVRVFDQLVYDNDPNLTNVLIAPDWKLWRIDFTRAFRTNRQLRNPKDLVRCDRQLFQKLKTLNADELTAKTKAYLTKDEISAVMARRDLIVQAFQKMIAEKGEKDVLY